MGHYPPRLTQRMEATSSKISRESPNISNMRSLWILKHSRPRGSHDNKLHITINSLCRRFFRAPMCTCCSVTNMKTFFTINSDRALNAFQLRSPVLLITLSKSSLLRGPDSYHYQSRSPHYLLLCSKSLQYVESPTYQQLQP